MLRRSLCEAEVTVRLEPVDPILIKSGYATIDGPDMVPVRTYRGGSREPVYFFPGTSLKGVLRSHLERIARTLRPGSVCLPYYEGKPSQRQLIPVDEPGDSVGCGHRFRVSAKEDTSAEGYADSCAACRMFGSLKFGGRFTISDAYPIEGHAPLVEDRNGVGIDRYTGGTVKGVLFDLRVLVGGIFEAKVRLTNFEDWQLAALGLLLVDLQDEILSIGSGRSRGLGRVRGRVTDFRVSYWVPSEHLVGIARFTTPEERNAYNLAEWSPEPPIELPAPTIRGVRRVYDLTGLWTELPPRITPAFDAFLQWNGGPKGKPGGAQNRNEDRS